MPDQSKYTVSFPDADTAQIVARVLGEHADALMRRADRDYNVAVMEHAEEREALREGADRMETEADVIQGVVAMINEALGDSAPASDLALG